MSHERTLLLILKCMSKNIINKKIGYSFLLENMLFFLDLCSAQGLYIS